MTTTAIPAAFPGWEREIPRYRATRDLHPSPNSRHRFEPPFASLGDPDVHQYATQPVKAGDEFESREWPHPSFHPLTFSAVKTLEFYTSRQRSRMSLSPWRDGRIVLEDGLGGPTQIQLSIKTEPRTAA
jgi:hypothetical protein